MRLFGFLLALFKGDDTSAATLNEQGRQAVRPFFEGVRAEAEDQLAGLARDYRGQTIEVLPDGNGHVIEGVPAPEGWHELRARARERGINIHGKGRGQLERELARKVK
ncbi:MAG: hypothetical protein ACYTBJ_16085 [Planctomycetota bacterium]|jgi:hypothetical protein